MPLDRRSFLTAAALAACGSVRSEELPSTGTEFPALAPFDALMRKFVQEHQAPGAALAVARQGKLVYARGFGWADVAGKRPVRPRTLFRIASVSKPITAAAVLQLVDRRKIALDDPVLRYVAVPPHHDGKKPLDPRWKQVTVRQCLQHTGGWDRDRPGGYDPIGIPWKIAAALRIKTPVPPVDVVKYMRGQPLDFDPGTKYVYSNLGYLLLGRAIESAAGEPYEAYVKKHVLAPLGVASAALGRALPEHRFPAEAKYYDSKQGEGECLYPPRIGKKVPWPDGAMNFEAFEAHGGWVASAPDLLRFAAAFDDPQRSPILSPAGVEASFAPPDLPSSQPKKGVARYYGCGWSVVAFQNGGMNTFHNGSINGTNSLLVRRRDGLSWAALFNTEADAAGGSLTDAIDGPLHQAADAVKRWPDVDLFEKLPSAVE